MVLPLLFLFIHKISLNLPFSIIFLLHPIFFSYIHIDYKHFMYLLSMIVWGNLVSFRNPAERLCVSWALPLNKRVRVSACKIHMPDSHAFVPTIHKCYKSSISNQIALMWRQEGYATKILTNSQKRCMILNFFQNHATKTTAMYRPPNVRPKI